MKRKKIGKQVNQQKESKWWHIEGRNWEIRQVSKRNVRKKGSSEIKTIVTISRAELRYCHQKGTELALTSVGTWKASNNNHSIPSAWYDSDWREVVQSLPVVRSFTVYSCPQKFRLWIASCIWPIKFASVRARCVWFTGWCPKWSFKVQDHGYHHWSFQIFAKNVN